MFQVFFLFHDRNEEEPQRCDEVVTVWIEKQAEMHFSTIENGFCLTKQCAPGPGVEEGQT